MIVRNFRRFFFPIHREKNIFFDIVYLDFIMVETHHRSGNLNYSNTFCASFYVKDTDYSASKRPTWYLVFPVIVIVALAGNVYLLVLSKATG